MKFLIDGNFKAVGQGDFVVAREEKEEFVFDTKSCDFSCATLLEIAKSNKLSLAKEKKTDMIQSLAEKLTKLNLKKVNKMTNDTDFEQIVLDGFANELSDDEIMIQMVEAGASFRGASKEFRRIVEEKGLRITAKARNEQIQSILEEAEFSAESYDAVVEMAQHIAETVKDTTEQQAKKAIRKYCKELEIEFPKAPKKPKGGLRQRFLDHAAANPEITDEELAEWYVANTKNKTEEDVEKWMNRYSVIINHGRKVLETALANQD